MIARLGDFVREIDVRRLTTRSTNYEVYLATGTISGTALDPSDRAAPKAFARADHRRHGRPAGAVVE
jgi:hypothetical protein